MNTKNDKDCIRITVDFPKSMHKKFKSFAAMQGKTMRDFILETIEEKIEAGLTPNEVTLKAIDNIEKGKNLVTCKDADDFFKKIGLK